MPFQPAGAAEVLRAAQKDENFMHHLKSCVSDIAQQTIGGKQLFLVQTILLFAISSKITVQ